MPFNLPLLRRWLDVLLRGLHLLTIVVLGAALLGAPLELRAAILAMLGSGVTLFAIQFWGRPDLFLQWSGLSLLIKLGLVALMLVMPGTAQPLFWGILIWSVIFAHAPATFRHRRLAGTDD
ncbi:MAG: hypothetical protein D6720_07920 [Gammaproteobacteria bacterium]|nr:MAG: hypothetical protein D6720_07920 [Gammaproteobacteria bacterium]